MPPFSPHHWHSRDKDNKYFWSLFRILANYTAIKFHLAVIWAEVRYIELLMVSSLPLFHLRHRLLLALRPYCVIFWIGSSKGKNSFDNVLLYQSLIIKIHWKLMKLQWFLWRLHPNTGTYQHLFLLLLSTTYFLDFYLIYFISCCIILSKKN